MKTNTPRHPRRSDEEWIQIIQECRTSGMSDKQWCTTHGICPSKLYYHIRRLTAKACGDQLPPNQRTSSCEKHEIVSLKISDDLPYPADTGKIIPKKTADIDTAIRLTIRNISMEITNHAEKDTIINTLNALRSLC